MWVVMSADACALSVRRGAGFGARPKPRRHVVLDKIQCIVSARLSVFANERFGSAAAGAFSLLAM